MVRRPPKHANRPAQAVPREPERELSSAEDRWLDLIADIIVEDLLNKEEQ